MRYINSFEPQHIKGDMGYDSPCAGNMRLLSLACEQRGVKREMIADNGDNLIYGRFLRCQGLLFVRLSQDGGNEVTAPKYSFVAGEVLPFESRGGHPSSCRSYEASSHEIRPLPLGDTLLYE